MCGTLPTAWQSHSFAGASMDTSAAKEDQVASECLYCMWFMDSSRIPPCLARSPHIKMLLQVQLACGFESKHLPNDYACLAQHYSIATLLCCRFGTALSLVGHGSFRADCASHFRAQRNGCESHRSRHGHSRAADAGSHRARVERG